MQSRESFDLVNYAPLSLIIERALFLAERAFLGRATEKDRETLSFLREVKRVTLLATTSLDFRVILVETLITDNAVSARSIGGSQNYLYLIRLVEANANMIRLKFLGPVLAISSPDLVDDRFLTPRAGQEQQFHSCERPGSVLVPSDWLLEACERVEFKFQVPNDQMKITPVPRITVLAEQQDLDPTPAGACVIPESSNSKHFFYDVQGFKYDMLTKDRGHERADKLMFITRAANADRWPYLYGRSMNYNAADIISVIRNEHDEDQHQLSVFSDLHLWLQIKGFLAVSLDKKLDLALRMQFSSCPLDGLSIQDFREISDWCIDSDRLRAMSSFKGRLAIRGFLESFEKLLVLVYSHEFKGVVRPISLILEGDLLAVTSDGFVVYQINRTLASLGRDFADRRVADFKLISNVAIACNSPTDVSRLMSFSLSSIDFSFDRERRYLAEVNQGLIEYPKGKSLSTSDSAITPMKKAKTSTTSLHVASTVGSQSANVKVKMEPKSLQKDDVCFFHLATISGYRAVTKDGSIRDLRCTQPLCPRPHVALDSLTREAAYTACQKFSSGFLRSGLSSHLKTLPDSVFRK